MKRCPECRRDYEDETLNFCLDDGAWLGEVGDEPETRHMSGETDQTLILTDDQSVRLHTADQIDRAASMPGYGGTGMSRDVYGPLGHEADGEKRHREREESRTRSKARNRNLLIAAAALILLAAFSLFLYRYRNATGTTGPIASIAVLPFHNTGGNADSEYLSDGLAESLIYRLSQIPELKVSPRSSVFRYKGKDVDPENVGTELGVDAVMSGRLIQRGDNLTISVDLVDVRNKKTLWGEQFERKMSDLLATQREIAAAITQKLQLKLSGSNAAGITKNYTNSNEAYQLYLQARFYWNKRTGESITKAIELLKAAVEKDPNFALAYAALADCYVIGPVYTRQRPAEAFGLARSNAMRSIELDPTLAEPHASLAMVLWFYDWDAAGSEREYQRSIELNPNYGTAHHWYSRLLRSFKRRDEAWREIKRAEELDPLSLIFINNIAEQQVERGDYDGAMASCRRMIDLDPTFWAVHQTSVWIYAKQGKFADALTEAQKAVELSGRTNGSLSQLGYSLGKLGRRDEALAVVRELEDKFERGQADARDIAVIYAGLDDNDKAIMWLEKAYEAHSFNMAFLNLESLLDPLNSDPRFADLKRKVGIP